MGYFARIPYTCSGIDSDKTPVNDRAVQDYTWYLQCQRVLFLILHYESHMIQQEVALRLCISPAIHGVVRRDELLHKIVLKERFTWFIKDSPIPFKVLAVRG